MRALSTGLQSGFAIMTTTAVIAFCSIMYELILAQTLTALFGGLILQYSLTIGFYLMGLGFGALCFEKFAKHPARHFFTTQLLLSLLGCLGFASLLLLSPWQYQYPKLIIVYAYLLVIAIGCLSGLEIPLINALYKREFTHVLGLDYFGGLAGGVLFPLLFYPHLGLVFSVLFIASLNLFACLWVGLAFMRNRLAIVGTLVTIGVFFAALWHHITIAQLLQNIYISGSFYAT